jgi:DNA N-6-adenine-methyltransferase (Dam)
MSSVHVTTASVQDHATPPLFLHAVEQAFGCRFILDLACNTDNQKCEMGIFLPEDSLQVDWKKRLEAVRTGLMRPNGDAWLNPPFRGVEPWMEKCGRESARGMRIVSLTLSSIGTGWYRDCVEGKALSLVLRKRITFIGQPTGFPKELMITLWGFGMTGFGFWDPPAWAVKESPKAEGPAKPEQDPVTYALPIDGAEPPAHGKG